jgi:excisionase family DNA binding protein
MRLVKGKKVAELVKHSEAPKMLRPKRVARDYGISPGLVYSAIYSGQLPAIKFRDRVWLIDPADVEAWIKANSEPNTLEAA